MSGFPLPCFDFDDDDEGLEVYPSIPSHQTPQVLDDADFEALRSQGLDINFSNPIRCTGNSTVYSAHTIGEDKQWAVKITEHKKQVESEYEKRQLLPNSPYLVQTISLTESPTKAILQMELCERGDIQNMVFDEPTIWSLIHDISEALYKIHQSGWLHLDISPGNILLSNDSFKLADFGTILKDGTFDEGCEGAGPYVSPEALAYPGGEYPVSYPTDIFSFGVVLLEAAAGKPAPRGGCDGYTKLRKNIIELGGPEFPCSMSEDLIQLINSMLRHNPTQRPTAFDLLSLFEPC